MYCLDSNTLIEAKNVHYAMDFCPAFWTMITQKSHSGNIFSIDLVRNELIKGNDELVTWVKEQTNLFVETSDNETQEVFIEIVNYVNDNYSEIEASKFLDVADPWLIAKCKTMGATLVTKEVLAKGARRVKIPNICEVFDVKYMQTHQMIRDIGVKFIL